MKVPTSPEAPQAPLRRRLSVGSRALAALVGGYALAALSSVALALAMKTPGDEGYYAATMPSFLVWALAVLWSFAARTALRAWVGLLSACAFAGLAAWLFSKGGGS